MADEWAPFKDEIIHLYLVEGLTLKDVSSQMMQRHGLDKKKHQYEYMLKKWNICKNTKKDMWEYVDHVVQQRQKQQKESRVRLHGILISESRVRKAVLRYGRRSLAGKFQTVPSPKNPEGQLIQISSPPREHHQFKWPEDLPWTKFNAKLRLVPIHLPESLMETMVRALATCSINTRWSKVYGGFSKNVELAISTALGQPVDWEATIRQTLPQIHDEVQQSLVYSVSDPPRTTANRVFRALLFQLSNNNINTTHPLLARNMMKLLHGLFREATVAVADLIQSRDLTAITIKETFFALLVCFGQSSLISRFLSAGIDPNILLNRRLEFPMELRRGKAIIQREMSISPATPLQLACAASDVQTARVLLEYQARPDFGNPTPLQIVCSRKTSSDSLKLARLLVEYGARLDTTQHDSLLPPLMEAVAQQDRDMVQFLLSKGVTARTVMYHDDDHERGTYYPSHIFLEFPKYRYRFDCTECEGCINLYHPSGSVTALQIAIIVNDSTIIEMLKLAIRGSKGAAEIYRRGLMTACLASDEGMVRQLLALDPGIQNDAAWINAAFCAVAWNLDCGIARLLLRCGIIPQWREGFLVSAVQVAALHGNDSLVEILHSCGYDINASGKTLFSNGTKAFWRKECIEHPRPRVWRPLECSIRLKHLHTAHTLLQLGAALSESSLHLALIFGNDDLVYDLVARGATVTNQRKGLIRIAIEEGKGVAVIRRLIYAGAVFSGTELVSAVKNDAKDLVDYLLLCGLDILASDLYEDTLLDVAAQVGNHDMVRRYLACGGHYSSKALLRAINRAILTSDHHIVGLLIRNRPPGPLDAYEATGFVQSVLDDHPAVVDLLLDLNNNSSTSFYCWHVVSRQLRLLESAMLECPDIKPMEKCYHDCYGQISPLWAAAYMQQRTLLQQMIDRSYAPDAFLLKSALYNPTFASKEIRQQITTAYPITSITDETICRKLLVEAIFSQVGPNLMREHVASLECLNFFFRGHRVFESGTPLQLATRFGHIDCVRVLLEAGADVNAPAEDYWTKTALQGAVEQGKYEMVLLLLEHGADVNGLPSLRRGMTAIELAAERGLIDMAALLLPHVALHGQMRLHYIRAAVFAEQGCHYAITELLKSRGGWTDEDRVLATTRQVLEQLHTCPRILYAEESWDNACMYCNDSERSSTSTSSDETEVIVLSISDEDESIVLSNSDMIEIQERSTEFGTDLPGGDISVSPSQLEALDYGATEFAGASFGPYDSTMRWLDDLARDYVDSLV